MADSRPAPLSFRPTRLNRDEAFFENLFEEAARRRVPDGDHALAENEPEPEDGEIDVDEEAPAQREGLPADYQMRHDAHYVDQIVSRRIGESIHLIAVSEIDGPHPVAGAQDLQPLVQSVARFGVLQPLLVRRHTGRYQLIAGSRRLAAAMAAGLSEVPCLIYFADEEKARALADAERIHVRREPEPSPSDRREIPANVVAELTEHLGAIGACLHLFGDRDRPLRERIALGLIQSEVQRAAWLSQALAVLAGDPPPSSNVVDLRAVIERIVSALEPERLLAGVSFEMLLPPAPVRIRGDEQLCALAVAGLVSALQPLVERAEGAHIRLALTRNETARTVAVEASQGLLTLPAVWQARFLDAGWTDRPGGQRAGVMLSAAGRVAALHNGALGFNADAARGCSLVLTFPGL